MKKITVLRFISRILLISFTATNLSVPPVQAVSVTANPNSNSGDTRLNSHTLSDVSPELEIPAELGTIQEVYKSHAPFVILIQDAHAIPEAQRKIRRLIEYFQTQYGVHLVALEGASSELDPQIFRSFPDKEILKETFEEYMEKGELTGGTAAAIFSEIPGVYHGIEDWGLYEEGVELYLKAMEKEEAILEKLRAESGRLQSEKEKTYSKALLEVDHVLEAFRRNELDLMTVLKHLHEKGTGNNSLPAPQSLQALLDEAAREGEDSSSVEREVRDLAEKIQEVSDTVSDTIAFNQKYQAFQTSQISAAEFAIFMKTFVETTGPVLTGIPFSEPLLQAVQRHKRLQDMEGTEFFRDFETYTQSVKESLFRNDAERALDQKSRRLHLLEKLAKLELSREEWEEIREALFVNRGAGVSDHLAFYRNAEKREEVFLTNLMKLIERRVSDTVSDTAALMVAGGFHTEGLARQFKEKGISYVVIRPEIGHVPEKSFYRAHMQGDVTWKDYFRVENGRVNLYEAFVRGTRDKLLRTSDQGLGTSQTGPGTILKLWRDQILRDLAAKKQLKKSHDYTQFLDELTESAERGQAPAPNYVPVSFPNPRWVVKIERFLSGLSQLDAKGQLNQKNILKLIQPAAIADLVTHNGLNPAARSQILGDYIEGKLFHGDQALLSQGVVNPPRSEIRKLGEIKTKAIEMIGSRPFNAGIEALFKEAKDAVDRDEFEKAHLYLHEVKNELIEKHGINPKSPLIQSLESVIDFLPVFYIAGKGDPAVIRIVVISEQEPSPAMLEKYVPRLKTYFKVVRDLDLRVQDPLIVYIEFLGSQDLLRMGEQPQKMDILLAPKKILEHKDIAAAVEFLRQGNPTVVYREAGLYLLAQKNIRDALKKKLGRSEVRIKPLSWKYKVAAVIGSTLAFEIYNLSFTRLFADGDNLRTLTVNLTGFFLWVLFSLQRLSDPTSGKNVMKPSSARLLLLALPSLAFFLNIFMAAYFPLSNNHYFHASFLTSTGRLALLGLVQGLWFLLWFGIRSSSGVSLGMIAYIAGGLSNVLENYLYQGAHNFIPFFSGYVNPADLLMTTGLGLMALDLFGAWSNGSGWPFRYPISPNNFQESNGEKTPSPSDESSQQSRSEVRSYAPLWDIRRFIEFDDAALKLTKQQKKAVRALFNEGADEIPFLTATRVDIVVTALSKGNDLSHREKRVEKALWEFAGDKIYLRLRKWRNKKELFQQIRSFVYGLPRMIQNSAHHPTAEQIVLYKKAKREDSTDPVSHQPEPFPREAITVSGISLGQRIVESAGLNDSDSVFDTVDKLNRALTQSGTGSIFVDTASEDEISMTYNIFHGSHVTFAKRRISRRDRTGIARLLDQILVPEPSSGDSPAQEEDETYPEDKDAIQKPFPPRAGDFSRDFVYFLYSHHDSEKDFDWLMPALKEAMRDAREGGIQKFILWTENGTADQIVFPLLIKIDQEFPFLDGPQKIKYAEEMGLTLQEFTSLADMASRGSFIFQQDFPDFFADSAQFPALKALAKFFNVGVPKKIKQGTTFGGFNGRLVPFAKRREMLIELETVTAEIAKEHLVAQAHFNLVEPMARSGNYDEAIYRMKEFNKHWRTWLDLRSQITHEQLRDLKRRYPDRAILFIKGGNHKHEHEKLWEENYRILAFAQQGNRAFSPANQLFQMSRQTVRDWHEESILTSQEIPYLWLKPTIAKQVEDSELTILLTRRILDGRDLSTGQKVTERLLPQDIKKMVAQIGEGSRQNVQPLHTVISWMKANNRWVKQYDDLLEGRWNASEQLKKEPFVRLDPGFLRSELRTGNTVRFRDLSASFDVAAGTDRERLQERIARAEILKWMEEDKRIQGYMKLLGSKKYGYTDWFFEPFDYGDAPDFTKTRLLDIATHITKKDQKDIIKEFPALKRKIKGKTFGLTASPYFLDLIDSAEDRKLILIHELLHAMYAADRPDIEKSIRRFIGKIQGDGASNPLKAGMESVIFQSIFLDNLLHAWAIEQGFEEDVRHVIHAKYGTLDHIQKSIQKFMRQDANGREEWRWRLEIARSLYRFLLPYDLLNRPPPEDEEKIILLLARKLFKTQYLYNHFVRTRRNVRLMLQKMQDNEFPSIEEFQKTFNWLQIPMRSELRSERETDPWDKLAKLREGIQRLREKLIRKKTSGVVLLRTALRLYKSYMILEKNKPSSNPDLFKASLDLHGEQLNNLTRSLMKQESEFMVKHLGLVGASLGILLSYLFEQDNILGLIAGGTVGFVFGAISGAMIFLSQLRRMYLSHQNRRDSDVTTHPGQRDPEDSEADPPRPSRAEVRAKRGYGRVERFMAALIQDPRVDAAGFTFAELKKLDIVSPENLLYPAKAKGYLEVTGKHLSNAPGKRGNIYRMTPEGQNAAQTFREGNEEEALSLDQFVRVDDPSGEEGESFVERAIEEIIKQFRREGTMINEMAIGDYDIHAGRIALATSRITTGLRNPKERRNAIFLYHPRSKRFVKFARNAYSYESVAFSKDGTRLLAVAAYSPVTVWDLSQPQRPLPLLKVRVPQSGLRFGFNASESEVVGYDWGEKVVWRKKIAKRSEVRGEASDEPQTENEARLPIKPLVIMKPEMFQNPEFLEKLLILPDSPLEEREKKILDMRYGLSEYDHAHTYADIAKLITDKTYTNVYLEVSRELEIAEKKARELWRAYQKRVRSEVRGSSRARRFLIEAVRANLAKDAVQFDQWSERARKAFATARRSKQRIDPVEKRSLVTETDLKKDIPLHPITLYGRKEIVKGLRKSGLIERQIREMLPIATRDALYAEISPPEVEPQVFALHNQTQRLLEVFEIKKVPSMKDLLKNGLQVTGVSLEKVLSEEDFEDGEVIRFGLYVTAKNSLRLVAVMHHFGSGWHYEEVSVFAFDPELEWPRRIVQRGFLREDADAADLYQVLTRDLIEIKETKRASTYYSLETGAKLRSDLLPPLRSEVRMKEFIRLALNGMLELNSDAADFDWQWNLLVQKAQDLSKESNGVLSDDEMVFLWQEVNTLIRRFFADPQPVMESMASYVLDRTANTDSKAQFIKVLVAAIKNLETVVRSRRSEIRNVVGGEQDILARQIVEVFTRGREVQHLDQLAESLERSVEASGDMGEFVRAVRSEVRRRAGDLKSRQSLPLEVSPETAKKAIQFWFDTVVKDQKGNIALGFDEKVDQNFLEALEYLKSNLSQDDRLFFSKEMAPQLTKEALSGFNFQFMGNLHRVAPLQLSTVDNQALPVVRQSEARSDTRSLSNSNVVYFVTSKGSTHGEPFLKVANHAADMAVALYSAQLLRTPLELKNPQRRAEIRAELVKKLFDNYSLNILQVTSEGLIVNRSELRRFITDHFARTQILQSA